MAGKLQQQPGEVTVADVCSKLLAMRILLIEDNHDLAIELAEYLEGHGHTIDAAIDGVTGLHLATSNDYDVILLDLMLPRLDGLEVCRQLRTNTGRWTPVIMLTARDTLEDRLIGFEHGADDYLIKPFAMSELHARLIAVQRRASHNLPTDVLRVADLELNMNSLEIQRANKRINIPPTCLKILELLMRASPDVVRRENLEKLIWEDIPPDHEVLRVHIHNLRAAIDKPFDTQLVHTVRGIGYRLAPDNAISS